MIGYLVLMLILLACSACIAGSESALFGLSSHQLYQFNNSSNRFKRLAGRLMQQPTGVLLTILIANTSINILIYAISYQMSKTLHPEQPILASLLGVLTVGLVIVLGEVTPKIIAISKADQLAPYAAALVETLYVAITPVRFFLNAIFVTPLTRLLVGNPSPTSGELTVEELQVLVEASQNQGVIGSDENDMLQEVVALSAIKVRSVMIPRVDMVVFDVNGPREQLLHLIRKHVLTQIPIYRRHIDQIVGVIHAKDVYLNPQTALAKLIQPVRFVPEQMSANKLLNHFRATHSQLAVVVDEYGGVAGLVTLEDLVVLVVGDVLEPEKDMQLVEPLGANSYRMAGDLNVESWSEFLGMSELHHRFTTLGGLIAARLGRLPKTGDLLTIGNVNILVEQVQNRRVRWVKIELQSSEVL